MIVVDNFIKDSELLKQIELSENLFPESMGSESRIATELNSYHYEQASCFAPYMFWNGWWKSETNTTAKKMIKSIWEHNLPSEEEEICGFEYWTRTFNPGQYLDTHVDEDTFLYAKEKIFRGPIVGCVYYPHTNDVVGGFLELHPNTIRENTKDSLESENIKNNISPIEDRERIACKPNRLVIFDAGHMVHNTTPPISGVRRVMVINVWHKDSPPSALASGEFYYE
jgi:hypothetical protein